MTDPQLALVSSLAFWFAGALVSILILWAVIRGAVLSALRKHSEELAVAQRRQTTKRSPATQTQHTQQQFQPDTTPSAF